MVNSNMLSDNHFNNGLLLLSYLVIASDGVIDDAEIDALNKICLQEGISLDYLRNFIRYCKVLPEKEVYNQGLDELDLCDTGERLRAFAWLYRLSEVDGMMHIKEVRFLMYSLKRAGMEFGDVISEKDKLPVLI